MLGRLPLPGRAPLIESAYEMILASLILAATSAAVPVAARHVDTILVPSEKAVSEDGKAVLSISCHARKAVMRLRWPTPIDETFLTIGSGSASEAGGVMDGMMGPGEPWQTIALPDRQTVEAPRPAREIVDLGADAQLLILKIGEGERATSAEFYAAGVKLAYDRITTHCR